jgi:alkanesulfonate monooxygenase SsuD/methylene tetrahydromethanopterin reductase-like flavin-dependent oxidoreductase (luciferase family)
VADDLAPGKFSTSEHHLDPEGVEALWNNGFTFANHAARTKNIKLIPMSIALTTINPIRAAEGMAPRDAFQSNPNFEAFVAPFARVPHWTEAW